MFLGGDFHRLKDVQYIASNLTSTHFSAGVDLVPVQSDAQHHDALRVGNLRGDVQIPKHSRKN